MPLPDPTQPDADGYLDFGHISRFRLNMQCEFGSRYIQGLPPHYPCLGDGLRFKGESWNHHTWRIHKDDIEEFIGRILNHLANRRMSKDPKLAALMSNDHDVTVLRRTSFWEKSDLEKIQAGLVTPIKKNPLQPNVILVCGNRTKEKIAELVGHQDFELEVIRGYYNIKLPFPYSD